MRDLTIFLFKFEKDAINRKLNTLSTQFINELYLEIKI